MIYGMVAFFLMRLLSSLVQAAAIPPADGSLDSSCTPRPALYQDWKRSAAGAGATDDDIRQLVAKERARVSGLPDPFTKIGQNHAGARAGERVLWEDMEVMVVVDRFSQAPKLLVIPKRELMFPLDTPRSLIDRLAQVSAGASDALIVAAGRKCSSKTYADIWINPPRALSVKQLHVHVRPRTPIVGNADTIYARTERRLRDVL